MTLKELYDSNRDVWDSEIPEMWKESWNQFIFGSGCLRDENTKEYIYFAVDFRRWYYQNKSAIERDSKINDILD